MLCVERKVGGEGGGKGKGASEKRGGEKGDVVKRGECREGKEKARGNLVCIGRGEFDRILLAKYLDRHIIPSLNI